MPLLKDSIQKPTVGRIVHFYTTDPDKQFNGQGQGPYPALVVQAGFSTMPGYKTMSNLKVFHFGGDRDEGSVSHQDQARANGDSARWWVWPPRE